MELRLQFHSGWRASRQRRVPLGPGRSAGWPPTGSRNPRHCPDFFWRLSNHFNGSWCARPHHPSLVHARRRRGSQGLRLPSRCGNALGYRICRGRLASPLYCRRYLWLMEPQGVQHRGRLEDTEGHGARKKWRFACGHSCSLGGPRRPPFSLRVESFLSIGSHRATVEIPGVSARTAFDRMRLPGHMPVIIQNGPARRRSATTLPGLSEYPDGRL
jgi:hypothetical protein